MNASTRPLDQKQDKITILFASDMNEISSETKGGFASIAYMLKQQREKNTPVFFFFGGGSIGPSLLSSFDRGSHIIDILNAIEPDVMSISKRDFSFFEDELSLRSYEAAFPLIASNIIETETKQPLDGLYKSVITQQGDYKIGVLSTLSVNIIEEYNLRRISVIDKFKAVSNEAKILREQNVDLVILINSSRENDVLPLLVDNTVDLILQKDSHATVINNRIIPEHPRYIFVKEIDEFALVHIEGVKNKLKVNSEFYKYSQVDKEANTQRLIQQYQSRLSNLLDEVIGTTKTPFNTKRSIVRTEESEFGNIVTDALKSYTDADIAIINGGSIRGEQIYTKNQNISRRDIISELPFRSHILVLELTGQKIIQAIEHGLTGIDASLGRFLQMSGLTITYNSKLPINERLISIKNNGKEIVKTQIYKVAMSNYLASGGDDFTMLKSTTNVNVKKQQGLLISEIVINFIRNKGDIFPKIEKRIINLNSESN
ncbi:5'-nucleotidase C-terminal domain-containing protein [Psychrosphaera aquimarina]|uniref:5'-nucleotidase C-terminal domain-containing protein n=1 Tax=Psychrosphaera aquimarina TaxID=2044854 RepID=A0ABU3QXT3_9GAMM|nr:5'-nucleotidase C-terminal domain-containing protein [Psychrosphaera aquimarina]MDU0111863.1 5'-nucleotidase C-terminal domain-containing protein [Psychrosphaera aquimarina]